MNLSRCGHLSISLILGAVLLVGALLSLTKSPAALASPGLFFAAPWGAGSDCTQAAPCDLSTALSNATDEATIILAQGTYTGTGGSVVTVTRSSAIYGGWDGAAIGPVVRDAKIHVTTLDGEGARRVMQITGPVTVTVEGLSIANGKTTPTTVGGWHGAGLRAVDTALTLRHTSFYSNVIDVYDYDAADSYAYGAGVYAENGTLDVHACTFRANSAWARRSSKGGGVAIFRAGQSAVTDSLFQDNDAWHGGGLYFLGASGIRSQLSLRNSAFVGNGWGHGAGRASGGYASAVEMSDAVAHVEGNSFTDNRAANDYAAFGVFGSDLLFTRNVIADNVCARTAGLYIHHATPVTVTNNIIVENRSTHYWFDDPAVRVRGGSATVVHNTIARNTTAYGVQVDSGATVDLTNNILVSHTVGISVTAGSTGTLEGTLWGLGAWANDVDWGGAGAISTGAVDVWGHPAFVAPDDGDYHIQGSSAAVNAGVESHVVIDIDGDPRPVGAAPDIGADEYVERVYLPLVMRHHP